MSVKLHFGKLAAATILAAASVLGASLAARADDVRIAMVVKNLGNGFFDAAHEGGEEAIKALPGAKLIYTGPTTPTAEGQIDIINSLIAQNVNAIVISANDPDALVPVAKKAMARGITVMSFDAGVAPAGRVFQLNPSKADLIGRKQIEMAAKTLGGKGEIAILSATAQATNQNIWIAEMKKVLAEPAYKDLKLVDVVYGDDQSDKSYREAIGLFRKHPDLKAIIAPTTVGITASAKAVTDQKLVGKVFVTGLGLPSEMAGHVHSGAVDTFAIWNPIDLGYTATYAAFQLATKKATGAPNSTIEVGRMKSIAIDASGEAAMSEPYVFDKTNVDKFAKIF